MRRAGAVASPSNPGTFRQKVTGQLAQHLGSCFVLLVVALAETWPLVRHLDTAIPGSGPGDNVTFLWNLWWMRHVGAHPLAFLNSTYVLWPFGANLVLHTHTMLEAFVAATVLEPVSIVGAQNLIVLASVFLNALTAYALAHAITRDRPGALLAAAVFGGAPYFAAHLEGHFNLTAGWVIPLWLLTARRAVRSRRAGDAAMAGMALAMAAYTDYYYLVYSLAAGAVLLWSIRTQSRLECHARQANRALMAAVWSLAALLACLIVWIHWSGGTTWRIGRVGVSLRGTFNPRIALWASLAVAALLRWRCVLRSESVDSSVRRADGRVAVIIGAVFCAAAAPLLVSGARLAVIADYVAPPTYFRSASRGVDLLALVGGNPRHPLTGRAVQQLDRRLRIDLIEGVAWLGVVPAVCAWLGWRRWPDVAQRRGWAWLFGVFLIWALGPFLVVAGWNTALVLPQTILRYVPILSNARIPSRAMVGVYLAVAILSAKGVATRSSRSRWLPPALIVLTIADYVSVPMPLWTVEVPSVYQELRARADAGALLELPLGLRDGFGSRGSLDPAGPWYQTIHQHPVVGGFVARIPERVTNGYANDAIFGPLLRASEPLAAQVPLPTTDMFREGLRDRGVRYVILRRSAASASIASLVEAALGSARLARDADRDLFEVRVD